MQNVKYVPASVTHAQQTTEIPRKTGLKNATRDARIVPDDRWPGMYRIRLPDGRLTDMLNLTRARDALRAMTGDR
jgi:hypothetical protein